MSPKSPDALARIGTEHDAPFFMAFFDTIRRTFSYQETSRATAEAMVKARGISIKAYKPSNEIMIQWLNAA